MILDLTLKNYRCFSDSAPAQFQLRPGFAGLVGANNSGKSSLLRFFYEFRNLFEILSTPSGGFVSGSPQGFNFASTIADLDEVFHRGNNRDLEIVVSLQAKAPPAPGTPAVVSRINVTVPRGKAVFTCRPTLSDAELDMTKVALRIDGLGNAALVQAGETRANLGTMIEAFDCLKRTLYVGPYRNAINVGAKQDYFDIHIGQAFIEGWRNFKSGLKSRDNETAHRVERDIQRIFGYSSLQINATPNDHTLQLFLNEHSFKLFDVGSGITQFIIVLANAAMRKPKYILIDEPELGLHPSLQLDFLTTLASYAEEGVLFATHSMGLARASAEHIWTLRKNTEITSEVRPLGATPRLSEFLGALGFAGYRELGFDRVLLVEGPKDVTAIQQLLRLYGKDHKVVLLPMGGNSMINGSQDTDGQLHELLRISPNISAIVDSERTHQDETLAKGRRDFGDLCRRVGVKCHVLSRRALENYWSDAAVKSVYGGSARALQPYELLKDAPHSWPKASNWRIAGAMLRSDLDATDLGEFLAGL
jgi:ABC-type cobalamin/Fe3+-siderophores transport system ATPase subunit